MAIMRINVGPIHPSTHGVLRLIVDVDGDTVQRVEPHIGFLHRGVEKLMETRMYMQNPSYTEKLDYIAPLSWDDLYVSAVEKAIGIEVKERAQYARAILLEFQRIASHLLWLGTLCNDMGQLLTVFCWAFRERAKVLRLLEDVSGGRMFYVNLRLGGLNQELPPDFRERSHSLADYLEGKILEYPDVLEGNPVFMERTKGIGRLSKADAINYGVSGPVLRASGVMDDARKSSPYYVYDKVKFRVPTGRQGDNFDRYKVRYEEMIQSIRIIRKLLEIMPEDGDVKGMPIKLIGPSAKPDPVLVSRELPRGEGVIYMIPDKQRPYRISLRSPTFINLAVLNVLTEKVKFADIFSILGSLDVVLGEVDK
ncbi:MAG: NADH-quinone oxidoreductase subunit D [Candidatus Micrarchaeota archaeon]|nr:NADH-quinone oxidoreductase subunit D [Candidatus Micrarchaeota archaeon]